MSDDGRWYQGQQQSECAYAGIDSQNQPGTGDELQTAPRINQDRNEANGNTLSGHFVHGNRLQRFVTRDS
jgi:hypothetical protein